MYCKEEEEEERRLCLVRNLQQLLQRVMSPSESEAVIWKRISLIESAGRKSWHFGRGGTIRQ